MDLLAVECELSFKPAFNKILQVETYKFGYQTSGRAYNQEKEYDRWENNLY